MPTGRRRECWEYADREHLVVEQVFTDTGASGMHLNRPGFNQMIQRVQEGDIQAIIVSSQDRIARSFQDYSSVMRWCRKLGVTVHVPCIGLARSEEMSQKLQEAVWSIIDLTERQNFGKRAKKGRK